MDGPNRAAAALVFGNLLIRGGKRDTVKPGNMFVIRDRGLRPSEPAPARRQKCAARRRVPVRRLSMPARHQSGKSWPYYYGIQPTGEPFIKTRIIATLPAA